MFLPQKIISSEASLHPDLPFFLVYQMEESRLTYYEWLKRRSADFVREETNPETASILEAAPDLFLLLLLLLRDRRLPEKQQRIAGSVLSYFLLPTDLIPETLQGVLGIREDLFLVALYLQTLKDQGLESVAETNWVRDTPLYDLVERILGWEGDMIPSSVIETLREAVRHSK